jgi:GNAT superfamily N-acetyltransferase
MSIDLTKISSQIGEMVNKLKSANRDSSEHLQRALDNTNLNIEKLKRKIAESKTTAQWPIAGLVDDLSTRIKPSVSPSEYTVLATDGSHIDIDRNQAARCYLINIGAVKMDYGSHPSAELDNFPRLYSNEEDLVISSRDNRLQKENVQGSLLDARRSVEECRKLAEISSGLPPGSTALAMMDGSLILFGLENYPRFVSDELLINGFLKHLDIIKELNTERKLVLASYISYPQSAHVVNALKVAACPYEKADCERYCSEKTGDCESISGIQDKDLFFRTLAYGERSGRFINPSIIVDKYYREHQVYFFYLRLEDEIARVEVPEWVAVRPDLLELAHILVLDQCRRGQGYPVALSEAHEQAVVTGADREQFWGLVEESFIEEKMSIYTSTKSRSKRTRWI